MVLVSHLHGDHFGGLPFLILEYLYESPRRRKLTLAGPPHLEERTWALFRGMYPESDASEIMCHLEFVVLEPGRTPFGQWGAADPNHQDPAHGQGHLAGLQG